MQHSLPLICFSLLITLLPLGGCAAAIVATTATVASTMHDRRTTATVMDDQEIKLRARATLSDHPEISEHSRIHVTSFNRRVLIFGQAETRELADKFAHLVSRQPKLKSVYNEVEVRPRADNLDISKDSALTTKVKGSLWQISIKGFDPTRVKISTTLGNVYLLGLVTAEEGPAIVEHVRGVSGVKKVIEIFEYLEG
ncbi:MAG: BON domain-containing protein [Gammaproteobacteria bacterium]|nr:BON domain-containing protein [Gammaproteobacteria bacterium]